MARRRRRQRRYHNPPPVDRSISREDARSACSRVALLAPYIFFSRSSSLCAHSPHSGAGPDDTNTDSTHAVAVRSEDPLSCHSEPLRLPKLARATRRQRQRFGAPAARESDPTPSLVRRCAARGAGGRRRAARRGARAPPVARRSPAVAPDYLPRAEIDRGSSKINYFNINKINITLTRRRYRSERRLPVCV